jgi:hypothetical protein
MNKLMMNLHIKNRCLWVSFIGPLFFLWSGCGIDDYVYLKPVTDFDWNSADQRITFSLPSNQTDDYFQEYVVYYRLYSSTTYLSSYNTISSLSSLNSSMYSDYLSVYPYSIEDDEAPTSLQYLLETTRSYKKLCFGKPAASSANLSTVNEYDESPLIDDNAGETVTIDFNLKALSYAHPCLIVNDTTYRMLRDESATEEGERDFLQDSVNSDDDDLDGDISTYTYVMFYVVATGIDDSFSTIFSQATFLGALRLPYE